MEMFIKLVRCAALMMVVFFAGCAESKFETYTGPEVTKLEVHKGDRIIKVFHGHQ
jgi:hypothetical protein